MRITITGASGFLGKQLVPYLQRHGVGLLLVGRDPNSLRQLFPGTEAIGYQEIAQSAQGHNLLLHLAVVNNDREASWEEFIEGNVDHAIETCRRARQAGIRKFIYVSSTHALDRKRQAEAV